MKQGKVVFIGEPNVGKSSLLNALVGESVSIVTDMAGTTRESVRGYLTGPDWQIAFLDTPGMDKKAGDKARDSLAKFMGKSISHSVAEADILCYVLDALDIRDEYIKKIENLAVKPAKPIIIAVNKVDKTSYQKLYPLLAKLNKLGCVVVPVSCKDSKNLDILIQEIVKVLPKCDDELECKSHFCEADEYTDQSVKKMCAEIIRGELIKKLSMEVPHGIAVNIKKFDEQKGEISIDAEIYCIKPSHKPIIIGKKGAVLKAVGTEARKKIQGLTGKHIYLITHVLVRENWREKDVKKYLE